ncbi:hypothetical protein CsSME_00011858 [Camellia sinensis var. sinensis]
MAVELCPENSSPGLITSPRISFSHDLSQSDIVPIKQRVLRSNSYDQQSSSADELFSDGKILLVQIRQKLPRGGGDDVGGVGRGGEEREMLIMALMLQTLMLRCCRR